MSERQGVEIDYCPECRGVWLDRGELDKLIEKAEASKPTTPHRDGAIDSHYDRSHDHNQSHYKHKKRESFLGDLFDF